MAKNHRERMEEEHRKLADGVSPDASTFTRWSDKVNDAGARGAVAVARGLNSLSRATGLPYNKGAVGVQTNADMIDAEDISRAVRPSAAGDKRGGRVKSKRRSK